MGVVTSLQRYRRFEPIKTAPGGNICVVERKKVRNLKKCMFSDLFGSAASETLGRITH